ncbi:MAG: DUF2202 domain-containing protein [Gammaproteobacteria bacterium]|nr:DUF2202 domain-containing protein [Gammaproteobacteria bacterium]
MTTLSKTELDALHEALEDEYRAWASYDQVIHDFGEVRPFINIREAEARHIQALYSLFEAYGIKKPKNTWPGKVEHYDSLHAACAAGVAAEIENSRMYERLLKSTKKSDILQVYRNLERASRENHLHAFERCVARGS